MPLPLPHRPSSNHVFPAKASAEPRPLAWPRASKAIPNFSDWLPGDIVVMETSSANNPVAVFQKRTKERDMVKFADWTHCAVYIGDGLIVDTRWKQGATIRRLFPETGHRRIVVRRFDPAIVPPAHCKIFADVVAEFEGVPYAKYWHTLQHAQSHHLQNGGVTQGSNGVPTRMICSSLVTFAAHRSKIAIRPPPLSNSPILPASLMFHPWLTDVPVEWRPTV
jgi:hypothetical protein